MTTITRNNTCNNPTWEQVLGENNWEGLIEPELDVSLRELIFRCGDFSEVTFDAFISEEVSPRRGESRYPMLSFFHDLNTVQNANNYQVIAFLYSHSGFNIGHSSRSSSRPNEVNWNGYVAVTTDEFSREIGRREIYVVWRPTMRNSEWVNNVLDAVRLVPADVLLADQGSTDRTRRNIKAWGEGEPRVHGGWLDMYTSSKILGTSARHQLWAAIKNLRQQYENDKDGLKLSVIVSGYSLGAALATLSAFDLVENGVVDLNTRVAAVIFGGAHVGNKAFLARMEALSKLKILHVKNKGDIITEAPGNLPIIGEYLPVLIGARYVPIETRYLETDLERSPYLKTVPESKRSSDIMIITEAASKDDDLTKLKKTLDILSPTDLLNFQNSLANISTADDQTKSIIDTIRVLLERYFPQLTMEYILNYHSLPGSLHLLDYFYGPTKVNRSLALVNKWKGFLKDELRIPVSWSIVKNKGMVQVDIIKGEWVLDPEPPSIDRKEEKNVLEPVSVPPTWERLIGTNLRDWKTTLLQEAVPNDPNLNFFKNFLLQCGNFAQATYDCFNSNPISQNCGNTRYGMTSFFDKVMLQRAPHYQVYSFLYAIPGHRTYDRLFCHPPYPDTETSNAWDREANWIGYVAFTTDEVSSIIGRREIYVVWRGTVTTLDSLRSFDSNSIQPVRPGDGYVHRAWFSIYNSSWAKNEYVKNSAKEQLRTVIGELINKFKEEPIEIVITGHSLGGALAVLSAYDLVTNDVVNNQINVSAVVFGSPRVGDAFFNQSLGRYSNLFVFPIRNKWDIVPDGPEWLASPLDEVVFDTKLSSCVDVSNSEEAHNLEVTLHMIAGLSVTTEFDGDLAEKFRSLALINKSSKCLTEPHNKHVPMSWWVEKNNGMVLDKNTKQWLLDPLPIN